MEESENNNIDKKDYHEQNYNHINYILDEEIFSKFSKEIFTYPIFGFICGIFLNIIYIYNWWNQKNIFALFINLYINFLIIGIILKKVFKIQEKDDKDKEKNNKSNNELEMKKLRERFRKIISLEDPSSTIRAFIYTYLCLIVSRLLGDKFIILFILNIFIFYEPLNNKFPNFVFNSLMYIKQTIEATYGIIECFIPRYIEKKEKIN